MISVVILTKNEEMNLGVCLDSLKWCDDVHVVDSGSTDGTAAIARSRGAHMLANPFASFAQQRNWALDHCALKHGWILFLDADEQATTEFHVAARAAAASAADSTAGFFCCWKLMLESCWLKHADAFPRWQLRLLKKGRVRFVDAGHGQKEGEVRGELAYLREPYLHFAYAKGWHDWIAKHNRYSDLEAAERVARPFRWRDAFQRHGSQRNLALKALLTRLPGGPLLRFFHAYVWRLGFLDGRPGLIHAANMMWYERMISLKFRELRKTQAGDSPPASAARR